MSTKATLYYKELCWLVIHIYDETFNYPRPFPMLSVDFERRTKTGKLFYCKNLLTIKLPRWIFK